MAPLEALGGSALFSDIFIGQDPKLFGRVSERSPKFLLPRSAFTAPIEVSQDTVLEQHSLFRGTGYDFLNLVSRASPLFRETV